QALLQTLFGVLIAVFSVRELWRLRRGPAPARPHGAGWGRVWMLLAGVTHGLYASGGPLLVYALSGVTLDKSRFRATLIMVWFTLNGLLTLGYAAQGALQPVWPQLAALAPVVLAGIVLGEILHHRVDEHRFRQVLFSVLLLAGLALVF
ncbi:MAG TPA: sulfite exporter TauE/SafE family protein, partial [Alcanivorax sp.]|nr:sulfite exporter TauE/SafE family protein [Alcanivorax sp.]